MIDAFTQFAREHLLLPLAVTVILIIFRPFVQRYLAKKLHLSQFGNWLTLYIFMVFILSYYQQATWLTQPLVSLGSFTINLRLLIVGFLILSLAYHLSKVITKQFLPSVYDRYHLDIGVRFTFNRIFHYIVMILAFLFAVSAVGLDLSALTVFASVLGVGIGFGLQNITSNFISGIVLLFERPIKIGDRVIVEEIIGDVEKINMRATIIRSINNEHIIVPNSYFLEEHVINRSYETPVMRLTAPVGVSYDTDPELVKQCLLDVAYLEAKENSFVLLKPEPFVHFVGFGNSSLDFELFVWVSDPRELIRVKTNINFKIFKSLKDHHIEIPFPQRDLHLRSVDKSVHAQFNHDD